MLILDVMRSLNNRFLKQQYYLNSIYLFINIRKLNLINNINNISRFVTNSKNIFIRFLYFKNFSKTRLNNI